MKKVIGLAFLLVVGSVLTSQAVVIHWATDGLNGGASSAVLVYVSSGNPSYAGGTIATGTEVGSRVSGLAITPDGVGEQGTVDSTARSGGNYYVVLFKTVDSIDYFSYSTSVADTSAITSDLLAPATGVFTPSNFSEWTAVPEPCAAALLGLGAAVIALRRRQRG